MLRVRAGAVYPITAPPITDGAVLVGDDGAIAAVGSHATVPAPTEARGIHFPEAVLVPGLVNTHTHLELTHLAGKTSERDFARWIRAIRTLKDATPPEEFERAAEQGVRDCWAAGITCVADTGSTGAPLRALARLGGRGIYYQEVFGPDPGQWRTSLAELEGAVAALAPSASGRARLGVSPHAPYTVSEALYRAVAKFARRATLPVAVHLAESPAETELVRYGTGPFADALRARGIPVVGRGSSPVEYLSRLGVLASRTCLCIHCVQVDARDIALLRQARARVAVCPRSNRAHAHGTAPLAALRDAGVPVGLGTDSVVSAGDVNLWAEAAAAGLEGAEALRTLTLEGARALGWDAEIGSLEVGKAGDLALFPRSLFDRVRPPAGALLTVVAGRVVAGYILER
ncbi:MAG TPA: amidohydrolase family protein [Gemmatimonadales bacterium]|nr:amidohydrolase family protein [Gemmatimonadales bacterium]